MKQPPIIEATLVADAIALGPHWIYDPTEIYKLFWDFDGYTDPKKNPYHNMKSLGDQTHYGDQMNILIESIHADGGYDPEKYMARWTQVMSGYGGYLDHATKDTLKNIQANKSFLHSGSSSFDGSVIGRVAPLLAYGIVDPTTSVWQSRIREFVALTHDHKVVQTAAVYFSLLAYEVSEGTHPAEAVSMIERTSGDIAWFIEQALKSVKKDTTSSIQSMWPACGIDGVFQWALHCILKYADNYKQAMLENVKAWWDSAARGMIIGMVLGAYLRDRAVPAAWRRG